MPGNPVKLQGLTSETWRQCPKLREDNHAVLSDWLGMSTEEVDSLASTGAIANEPPG